MSIRIARHHLSPDTAARWLVGHYSPSTVRYYDCAGGDFPVPSPAADVALEDLGRLVCIGAGLTYQRGHALLEEACGAPWPQTEIPEIGHITDGGEAFYGHAAVDDLWNLFHFWWQHDGLKFGTISKLLHIKWPEFVPITDSEFTQLYREEAVQAHNASELLRAQNGDRAPRRTTANVRAYWRVFREDVVSSRDGLGQLRRELHDFVVVDEVQQAHRDRLGRLSDVRLLDALAWGLGSGRLRPGG